MQKASALVHHRRKQSDMMVLEGMTVDDAEGRREGGNYGRFMKKMSGGLKLSMMDAYGFEIDVDAEDQKVLYECARTEQKQYVDWNESLVRWKKVEHIPKDELKHLCRAVGFT